VVSGPTVDHTTPLQVRLSFPTATVSAGSIIHGDAVVTNTTDTTIRVHDCRANSWPVFGLVGLTGPKVASSASIGGVGCAPQQDILLKPGTHSFPISLISTYSACSQTQATATPQVPQCKQNDELPPLPLGRYRTVSFLDGLAATDITIHEVTLILVR
jgi:hypothetical protein